MKDSKFKIMDKRVVVLWCLSVTVFMSGCGSFDLFKSKKVESEKDSVQEFVREFREFESFSADIPMAWIELIRLPSGTEIVFNSREMLDLSSETTRGDTSGISNIEHSTLNNEVDDDVPMVRLGYERGSESRDSSRVVESEDRTESIQKETNVDTGNWLVWLFVGIAVALAGVIALWIYKPW